MLSSTRFAALCALALAAQPSSAWQASAARPHVQTRAHAHGSSAPRFSAVRRVAAAPRSAPAALTNADIVAAFSAATFWPQPFWLLMIIAPRWPGTKAVMRPLAPIVLFSLVHLFIVVASIGQEGGTAPMLEFQGVFDASPTADPQGAMVGMMRYPNFVTEEWSHVLTWDIFVGRFIWADGLRRGVPIRASVLLTNLIGPPGLLLHLATCVLTGKGLPPDPALASPPPLEPLGAAAERLPARADELARLLFAGSLDESWLRQLGGALADGVVWDDLSMAGEACVGREAVLQMLAEREASTPATARLRVERVADGASSTGIAWTRVDDGAPGLDGLRGTTYIELDPTTRKIAYVQEVAEPLVKPGDVTAKLLKAIAKPDGGRAPVSYRQRTPKAASDLVKYLWAEVQGSDASESLRLFDEAILYEDYNFPQPFVGIDAARAFIEEFDIPGIQFEVDRISEGERACCFTWRIAIAGVEGRKIRGISFYELNPKSRKVAYVRDIPEPAFRPAPLLALAGAVRPGLRVLQPQQQ